MCINAIIHEWWFKLPKPNKQSKWHKQKVKSDSIMCKSANVNDVNIKRKSMWGEHMMREFFLSLVNFFWWKCVEFLNWIDFYWSNDYDFYIPYIVSSIPIGWPLLTWQEI